MNADPGAKDEEGSGTRWCSRLSILDKLKPTITGSVIWLMFQMEVEKWLEELRERGSQIAHDKGIEQLGTRLVCWSGEHLSF